MNIDRSKAPEGSEYYALDQNGDPVFYKDLADDSYLFWWPALNEWRKNHGRPSYGPLVPMVWRGEGLPPVGMVCEHRTGPGMNWSAATVLAYGEKKVFYRDSQGFEWTRPFDEIEFRPILTPEQIAAEERDQARTEVLNAMTADGKLSDETEDQWQYRLKVVGEMLDMGYRKQVTP